VFSGENWLSVDSSLAGYNSSKSIVASFSRSGGSVSVGTISIDLTATELIDSNDQSGILDAEDTTANGGATYSILTLDISTITDTDDDLEDLEQMIAWVDDGIGSMTTAASNLGAVKQRTNMQREFIGSLMDAISRGVGALVDADMNEESTRLQALQVQQQLGIQSLSIANQNSQQILSLFR
jgi:flagellin